jgi:hypothetical protein
MVDEIASARLLNQTYGIVAANHPLLAEDLAVAKPAIDARLPRWPVTHGMETWLVALNRDRDVEGVVLKVAAERTGLDLGVSDFDVTTLRRKARIPIITTSEIFGME